MKRSFFFAVTVCTLAIAAVSATKANQRLVPFGFTNDPISGNCEKPSGIDCDGRFNPCLNNQGAPLFAFDDQNPCSEPLHKD